MGFGNRANVKRMLGPAKFTRPGAGVGLKRAKAGVSGGIIITGDDALDRKLATMHGRIQKKLARKATRRAAKEVVLPEAKAMAPIDTGALEKSLTVRAMKRSRTKVGHIVTTRDPGRGAKMFKGKFFYGFFHEFGTVKMQADPFLRPALYGNEMRIRNVFQMALQEAIKDEEVRELQTQPF